MPDTKGTIIELTEEQKKLMREATGADHEAIKVEVGPQISPTPLSKALAKKVAKKQAKKVAKKQAHKVAKKQAKKMAKKAAKKR